MNEQRITTQETHERTGEGAEYLFQFLVKDKKDFKLYAISKKVLGMRIMV